jgi:hypothetical protein
LICRVQTTLWPAPHPRRTKASKASIGVPTNVVHPYRITWQWVIWFWILNGETHMHYGDVIKLQQVGYPAGIFGRWGFTAK